ncbi:MAG: tRNA epoxyqueuosine(34) reductase QueG [Lentisphaeria bacterium]|nr:tRNA epoxyqueuosine(34) reductase QueG [Lentisphaeria bacterium]NQZ69724.1 tRNA epoxyqueuosine(34) reductase QueG [Lentisphaeria bacterium]
MSDQTKADIKLKARELGFDICVVADAELPEKYSTVYEDWIAAEMHGTMDYLAKRLERNIRIADLLPGTKSMIMLGVNYHRPDEDKDVPNTHGQISRYAVTRDYHKTIRKKLKDLAAYITETTETKTRVFVDTGPLMERAYAEMSGLGYVGKNTMLITENFGSWVFLACVLCELELHPDKNELTIRCGSCRSCIDDCPTDAILENGQLDARKCISYLTIENKGPIPLELRKDIGNWLFGCDICQEVCPHNNRAQETQTDDFQAVRFENRHYDLSALLSIYTKDAFLENFAGTPIMRAGWAGMLRNAAVVAGNSRNDKLIPVLNKLIEEIDDEMVIEHAQWAIQELSV